MLLAAQMAGRAGDKGVTYVAFTATPALEAEAVLGDLKVEVLGDLVAVDRLADG